MKQLAESIVEIIKDYHNYLGFQFTPDYVLAWVNQFDEGDRNFVLVEFLHLLKQGIYISETKARQLLFESIIILANKYGYNSPIEFLQNTNIIRLQGKGKSQSVLLDILNEELLDKLGVDMSICGTKSTKYAVYIDDLIATGGTAFRELRNWLLQNDSGGTQNLKNLNDGKVDVLVISFCCHNANNVLWRLKLDLKSDAVTKKIKIYQYYEVQNHLNFLNQKYNFAYPTANQPASVSVYYKALPASAEKHSDKTFRNPKLPAEETFFSSPGNRIHFENILLSKGVELLNQAKELKPNHRPLGAGFPSHRTLGTGTLFFTWRNISNTCPIVFWWESPAWKPLFPLKGRGLQIQ